MTTTCNTHLIETHTTCERSVSSISHYSLFVLLLGSLPLPPSLPRSLVIPNEFSTDKQGGFFRYKLPASSFPVAPIFPVAE